MNQYFSYLNFILIIMVGALVLGMNADNPNLPNSLRALAQTTNEIIRGNGVSTSMAQFTGTYTLGKSEIYQDSAKNIGIGTQAPVMKLDLNGALTTNNNPIYGYDVCGTGTGIMKCLNSLRWTDIAAIPAGFADGVDDVGAAGATYTAGQNITINASNQIAVIDSPTFQGSTRFGAYSPDDVIIYSAPAHREMAGPDCLPWTKLKQFTAPGVGTFRVDFEYLRRDYSDVTWAILTDGNTPLPGEPGIQLGYPVPWTWESESFQKTVTGGSGKIALWLRATETPDGLCGKGGTQYIELRNAALKGAPYAPQTPGVDLD